MVAVNEHASPAQFTVMGARWLHDVAGLAVLELDYTHRRALVAAESQVVLEFASET